MKLKIFIAILFLAALKASAQYNDISFLQGSNTQIVRKNIDSVFPEKKPFSIQYFGKKYENEKEQHSAMKIAVLSSSADIGNISIGTSTADIPYFADGTGLAANDTGYDEAFINNDAHHYLYYEDDHDRRVKLISKSGDFLKLEWAIPQFYYNEKDIKPEDLSFSVLYFVFFADRNNNNNIDKDEVKVVTVSFR